MQSPIVGTAYTSLSRNANLERLVNLYLEVIETKSGKSPAALFGCPGLVLKATLGIGPIRPGGLHVVENTLYVASANQFYTVTPGFAATLLGTLNTTSGPVTIIDNGSQVAISDNTAIYTYSAGSFATATIASPGPPGTLVYQDTLGLYNELGTFKIWQSNPNDLTTWSGLNLTTSDGSSDSIVGLGQLHRQIVAFKRFHTPFYINAGNQGFVFQRLEGVYPDIGCASAASITNVGDEICWLGQDRSGQGVVYAMSGYEPRRISTHAIEQHINKYPTITDAIGGSYMQEGHRFYILSFPSGNQTWVVDVTASQMLGFPVWHERAAFSNGALNIYEPNSFALFAGQIIAASSTSGNLYALDLNTFTDNGLTRKWLRAWRAHQKPSQQSVSYRELEIDMESGTCPVGTNPQIVLRYTDDAHTWSSEHYAPAGQSGDYAARQRFRRLGLERRGLASDRVFELSSTDNFKVAIMGAIINDGGKT